MTRTKSAVSTSTSKRLKSVKKSIPKPAKSTRRTIRPKRKVKSVLVDVIEDESLDSDLAWLAADDKLRTKQSNHVQKDTVLKNDFKQAVSTHSPVTHQENDEIDSQKIFFKNLAKEIKTEDKLPEETDDGYKKRPSITLYRHLVVKFIILVTIVAVVVAYFSFSKLTVTLNLKGETINTSLLLKIVDPNFKADNSGLKHEAISASALNIANLADKNDPRETIQGTIKEISATVVKNYPANGETFLGNEIIGRVTIINNYYRNQPLVATTRLLSPDNKLYRIKNAVNVPAGGQVSVDIYTNKPSPSMAIGPTTFTIPGLWAGLQDKIYAKSNTPFTYTQEIRKYVNSSDLAYAAENINRILITQAKIKAKADTSVNSQAKWLYIINNPATITINAKAGDKRNEFTAKASGKIIAVSFPRDEVAKLAMARLRLSIPNDKELVDFNPAHIIYTLMSYNSLSHSATVKATFTGVMILKKNSDIINPKSLVNLTAQQLKTYLQGQPEVSSYTLKFFPGFVKRAPSLVDRIKININKN